MWKKRFVWREFFFLMLLYFCFSYVFLFTDLLRGKYFPQKSKLFRHKPQNFSEDFLKIPVYEFMTLQHFFYSFTKQTGNLWKSFWKLKKYIFVLIFPKTFPKIFKIPKLFWHGCARIVENIYPWKIHLKICFAVCSTHYKYSM